MIYIPNKIGIVDDFPENLKEAQKGASEVFPDAEILLFKSAAEILEYLSSNNGGLQMLLTDLRMEEAKSGYQVMIEGWSWGIPTIIITGGFRGHGGEMVKYFPGSWPSIATSIRGDKSSSDTWIQVIKSVLENPLVLAFARRTEIMGASKKDVSIGEDISSQLETLDEMENFWSH